MGGRSLDSCPPPTTQGGSHQSMAMLMALSRWCLVVQKRSEPSSSQMRIWELEFETSLGKYKSQLSQAMTSEPTTSKPASHKLSTRGNRRASAPFSVPSPTSLPYAKGEGDGAARLRPRSLPRTFIKGTPGSLSFVESPPFYSVSISPPSSSSSPQPQTFKSLRLLHFSPFNTKRMLYLLANGCPLGV